MDGLQLQERLSGIDSPLPLIIVSAVFDRAARGEINARRHRDRAGKALSARSPGQRHPHRNQNGTHSMGGPPPAVVAPAAFRRSRTARTEGDGDDRPRAPNKTIARKLGVSQRTTNRLRASIFEKMGAESAVALARIAGQLQEAPSNP